MEIFSRAYLEASFQKVAIPFCLKILQPYVLFMERSFGSRWYLYRFLTGKRQVQADFFPAILSGVVWQSVFTDLANQLPQKSVII